MHHKLTKVKGQIIPYVDFDVNDHLYRKLMRLQILYTCISNGRGKGVVNDYPYLKGLIKGIREEYFLFFY